MREYKGFKISVTAGKHPTRNEWSPSGVIQAQRGGETEIMPLATLGKEVYPTREDAITAGYEILKRRIDAEEF